MFEVVTRDGAARRGVWKVGEVERLTPLTLYVESARFPAPSHARATLGGPGTGATVVDLGSRFQASPAPGGAALSVEADLPYAPAGGQELLQAAQQENLEAYEPGSVFVAADPAGPFPESAEVVAMGSARALLDNPYAFAGHVTRLRESMGPARVLYAPGCGFPHEMAFLAYVGVDLFDSAPAIQAARAGSLLTPEGPVPWSVVGGLPFLPDGSPTPEEGDFRTLLRLNQEAQAREEARVHAAIAAGKLRELVEQRVRALPNLAANLRRCDLQEHAFFEARAPLLRSGPLYATSKESIQRPEVARWHRRLETRYEKPRSARVLVLLPCSARKPYSTSRTHRRLAEALGDVPNRQNVHEVIVTSPLGVVPRELENTYPAAHYDLPVTGHWDEDEKLMIREAITALLERNRYDHVVVHLEESEMEIVAPVLPDHAYTVEGDPLSDRSLDLLRAGLSDVTKGLPRVPWRERNLDDVAALARWQFGRHGRALIEGAEARGRRGQMTLRDLETDKQIASLVPERGLLSLTLEGGRRLLDAGAPYRVEIEDFRPKGTIFAVGVKSADPEIRVEDEVVVHHGGELRGVGRAIAPGVEMPHLQRGGCVGIRHTA